MFVFLVLTMHAQSPSLCYAFFVLFYLCNFKKKKNPFRGNESVGLLRSPKRDMMKKKKYEMKE